MAGITEPQRQQNVASLRCGDALIALSLTSDEQMDYDWSLVLFVDKIHDTQYERKAHTHILDIKIHILNTLLSIDTIDTSIYIYYIKP